MNAEESSEELGTGGAEAMVIGSNHRTGGGKGSLVPRPASLT